MATCKQTTKRCLRACWEKILPCLIAIWNYLQYLSSVIGEMTTGGFLVQQTELAHGSPLAGEDTLSDDIKEYAVKERDILFIDTMTVEGTDGHFCQVQGLQSLILGRHTMTFFLTEKEKRIVLGEQVLKIRNNRKEPGFVFTRGKTDEIIGRVQKMGDDYGFFLEPTTPDEETGVPEEKPVPEPKEEPVPDAKESGVVEVSADSDDEEGDDNEVKNDGPAPVYKCSGDFINRRFLMKNAEGENVAKIKKGIIAFPAFDHYIIRVAPGMDPLLVVAFVCVIDEDLEKAIREAALYVPKKVVGATMKVGQAVGESIGERLQFLNPFKKKKEDEPVEVEEC